MGGSLGALTASGLYIVIYTMMHQGGRGLLPVALVIAGATFVTFFLLFFEFTFWRALWKIQRLRNGVSR